MDNRLFFCYADSGYYHYNGLVDNIRFIAAERLTDRVMKSRTIKSIVVSYK